MGDRAAKKRAYERKVQRARSCGAVVAARSPAPTGQGNTAGAGKGNNTTYAGLPPVLHGSLTPDVAGTVGDFNASVAAIFKQPAQGRTRKLAMIRGWTHEGAAFLRKRLSTFLGPLPRCHCARR
jgi:hypothetical protein